MNKVITSAADGIALIPDGATIMCGGFGLCGLPENLIRALHARGTRDLTVISNNPGVDDFGVGMLVRAKQVSHFIGSYVGENKEFERQEAPGLAGSSRRPATARSSPRGKRRE
jgi:3-oxoacid CoA-transferase subunit A